MRWLIFLSRVAFLCGVFMVVAFALLFIEHSEDETVSSAVIMAGYGLAMVVLPITGLSYLITGILARRKMAILPRWLIISNILFLIAFLIFTFYINDPYYR